MIKVSVEPNKLVPNKDQSFHESRCILPSEWRLNADDQRGVQTGFRGHVPSKAPIASRLGEILIRPGAVSVNATKTHMHHRE